MPDLSFPLQSTQTALTELQLSTDLETFARRHWTLPSQPQEALEALLLGPATPAHSPTDLALGLDWGPNRFGPILATPSPQSWQRFLRRVTRRRLRQVLWRYHGPFASPATRSRYRITFIWDTTTLLKVGEMLGLADTFYSGMLDRPAHSIEVVLLYALVGDDFLCLPMDFQIRKPDPDGPGRPCLTAIQLADKMICDLDNALRVDGLSLKGHYLVADAWFADAQILWHAYRRDLIPLVPGKTSFHFEGMINGQPFDGTAEDLLTRTDWTWKHSPQMPGWSYVRLSLYSRTFHYVTLTLFLRPGEITPSYLLCLDPDVASPRLLRAYHRRPWVEACFEVCKATLGLEHFKVRTQPGSIYGFIALRLLSFVLFDYAGRRVTHGRLTAGQIIRQLRYHGTLWLKQFLEKQALSDDPSAMSLVA